MVVMRVFRPAQVGSFSRAWIHPGGYADGTRSINEADVRGDDAAYDRRGGVHIAAGLDAGGDSAG